MYISIYRHTHTDTDATADETTLCEILKDGTAGKGRSAMKIMETRWRVIEVRAIYICECRDSERKRKEERERENEEIYMSLAPESFRKVLRFHEIYSNTLYRSFIVISFILITIGYFIHYILRFMRILVLLTGILYYNLYRNPVYFIPSFFF